MGSSPDWKALAESFGWTADVVTDKAEVEGAMRDAVAAEGPVLLDVRVTPRGELLPDDPGRRRRPGHGGLMEAGTPDLVRLEDLEVGSQLTGRKHILSLLVENRPGVLARIAGLFSRRGFNIDTLTVGPTDDPNISRITLTLDGAVHPIDQVTKQLHKLVNVIKIRDMEPGTTIAREMALFKITASVEIARRDHAVRRDLQGQDHRGLAAHADRRDHRHQDKIDAFERMIRPHGLVEMARTGEVAIARSKADA